MSAAAIFHSTVRRSARIKALKDIVSCNGVKKEFSSLSPESVQHNEKKKEFFIQLGKDKAFLQYEPLDKATVELWHTEVPDSLRGKGVAKILAEAAFDHFVEADKKMAVTCDYLKKYISDNPKLEYTKRIVK